MKKSNGCPADGIEGFRLFMTGNTEKPASTDVPIDVMRFQLNAINKKNAHLGASPAKIFTQKVDFKNRTGIMNKM
jgi:hypothetical protein